MTLAIALLVGANVVFGVWLMFTFAAASAVGADPEETPEDETLEAAIARLAPGYVQCLREEAEISPLQGELRKGIAWESDRGPGDTYVVSFYAGTSADLNYVWLRRAPSAETSSEG